MKYFLCLFIFYLSAQDIFLTQSDIEMFYREGFVLKKQAFDPRNLSEEIDSAINLALEIKPNEEIAYLNGSRVIYKNGALVRINGCAGIEPRLNTTLRSEKILRTFFALLGTNEIEQIIAQIHPKLPGDGVAYQRYQDVQFRKAFDPAWQDILGNGSYVICIIPVDATNKENGGSWVEPFGTNERIYLDAGPGDLLFMHPYLWHGSEENLSPTKTRRTLLTGFCAFGANHKAYPGAFVNTKFSLNALAQIEMSDCPWSQTFLSGPTSGH